MEKRKYSYTVAKNVHWFSHCDKQYEGFSKNLEIKLPYDPLVLGIYPKETKILIQKDTCTLIFIVGLVTIAKVWKQPKCPSADKWIKIWYTYNRMLFSYQKRMEFCHFCSKVIGLGGSMQNEISQTEKD